MRPLNGVKRSVNARKRLILCGWRPVGTAGIQAEDLYTRLACFSVDCSRLPSLRVADQPDGTRPATSAGRALHGRVNGPRILPLGNPSCGSESGPMWDCEFGLADETSIDFDGCAHIGNAASVPFRKRCQTHEVRGFHASPLRGYSSARESGVAARSRPPA
jgi:hypothetical protein